MSACINVAGVGDETGPAFVLSTRPARVVPTAMYCPLRIADVRLLPISPVMMETLHTLARLLRRQRLQNLTCMCVLTAGVLLRYQKRQRGNTARLVITKYLV